MSERDKAFLTEPGNITHIPGGRQEVVLELQLNVPGVERIADNGVDLDRVEVTDEAPKSSRNDS
jgi:hypothetical protein